MYSLVTFNYIESKLLLKQKYFLLAVQDEYSINWFDDHCLVFTFYFLRL